MSKETTSTSWKLRQESLLAALLDRPVHLSITNWFEMILARGIYQTLCAPANVNRSLRLPRAFLTKLNGQQFLAAYARFIDGYWWHNLRGQMADEFCPFGGRYRLIGCTTDHPCYETNSIVVLPIPDSVGETTSKRYGIASYYVIPDDMVFNYAFDFLTYDLTDDEKKRIEKFNQRRAAEYQKTRDYMFYQFLVREQLDLFASWDFFDTDTEDYDQTMRYLQEKKPR